MPVVELLGPSGVGKSTALEALFAHGSDPALGSAWRNGHDVVKALPRPASQSERNRVFDDPALRPVFDVTMRILAASPAPHSRRSTCLKLVERSGIDRHLLLEAEPEGIIVHDELVLHRAFSLLPLSVRMEADAEAFFAVVPLPEVAVVCVADAPTLRSRIRGRPSVPNCYRGLSEAELGRLAENLLHCCVIATAVLSARGAMCRTIDLSGDVTGGRAALDACLRAATHTTRDGLLRQ